MKRILRLALVLVLAWAAAGAAGDERAHAQRLLQSPVFKIDTNEKVVALTFDDGPDPTFTPVILELLHREGVVGTFFVIGKQADRYPKIIEWMYKAGHEVANHGYSHADPKKLGKGEVIDEIRRTEQAVLKASGTRTRFYRPMGGTVTPSVLRACNETGYELIHWSVDPKDWRRDRTSEVISNALKNHVDSGDIVLFHDGGLNQEESIKALAVLIGELKGRGYHFVTISQLLGME